MGATVNPSYIKTTTKGHALPKNIFADKTNTIRPTSCVLPYRRSDLNILAMVNKPSIIIDDDNKNVEN